MNPNLAGDKPVGYLKAWSRLCTQDYQEEIHLHVAARAGVFGELSVSILQLQTVLWVHALTYSCIICIMLWVNLIPV